MTVLFWRDIEGDKELFEPYQNKIQQLQAGEYTNLTLERLVDEDEYPLYTIRASKSRRILFTTRNGNLFLLDVIENHDHQKCRFLKKSSVLPAYMQKVAEKLRKDPNKFALCEKVAGLEEESSQSPIKFRGIEFHNQQLIHFTDDQETTRSIKTPAVGLGPAGSGKTSVALSIALQQVRQGMNNNDSDQKPVLFLSRSPGLIDQTRENWVKLVTDPILQKQVEFLTLEQLVRRKNPKANLTKGSVDFFAWCKSKKIKPEYDLERVWLEFRIASGYTAEEYAALGNKQSCTFVAEDKRTEARQEISGLFNQYLTYLKNNDLIDLELNFPEGAEDFSLVLLDEAQDCTCDQLKKAKGYAENANIVYFLGDHQILFDGKSRLSYLRYLYNTLRLKLSEQRLTGTFRCPQAVIDVANLIVLLKLNLVGGAADKGESHHLEVASTANNGQGEIKWLSTTADMSDYYGKGTELAVVTAPEFVEEAKRKFGTNLVFTPAQIKGLEYQRIVLWKLFETKAAYAANKQLDAQKFVADHSGNRAKDGQSREEFLPFCDELNTAVTRAKIQLVMVQDSSHQTEHLVNALKPIFEKTATNSTTKVEFTSANTKEDWQREAIRQRNMGNTSQADAIDAELSNSTASLRFFPSAASTSSTAQTAQSASTSSTASAAQLPVKEAKKNKGTKGAKAATPSAPVATSTSSMVASLSAASEKPMHVIVDNFLRMENQNVANLVNSINRNRVTSREFLKCLVNHPRFYKLPIQEMLKYNLIDFLKEGLRQIHQQFISKLNKDKWLHEYGNKDVGNTPVIVAAIMGLDKAIELLKNYGADLNAQNIEGVSAVQHAIVKQKVNSLTTLIKLKANLNLDDPSGANLAHCVVYSTCLARSPYDLFKILKDNKVDLNAEAANGLTPAATAIVEGDISSLKALKRLGVDLNQLDSAGFGLVHYAVLNDKFSMLSVLNELGVDLNQCTRKKVNMAAMFERLKLAPLPTSDESLTPIELATQFEYPESVEKLVDLGVDPHQKVKEDYNLGHIAAGYGSDEVLEYLRDQGVNLAAPSIIGSTPTHRAGDKNHTVCLSILKECGMPFDVPNNYGFTPFISAIWNKAQASVDFFVREYPSLSDTPWVFSRSKLQSIPDDMLSKPLLQTLEENLDKAGKTDDEVSLLPHELATMLGFAQMSLMIQMSGNEIFRRSKKVYGTDAVTLDAKEHKRWGSGLS